MAGRPRKVESETPVTEVSVNTAEPKVDTTVSDSVADELRKENAELKEQIAMILQKLNEPKEKEEVKTEVDPVYSQEVDDFVEINPMKPIRVISLSDGGVNLKTTSGPGQKVFRLDKFGHSVTITYSDLQDVISTCRSFIEDGTVYICDKNVVHNNYLDEYYKKFLTVETMTNILTFDKDKVVDMVKNTTVPIQETIISLICDKINRGEYVDMNKVDAIGKACKTPCDIMALAMQKRAQ